MISRMRLYMTFDEDWVQQFSRPSEKLHDVLVDGFEEYGEVFLSFNFQDDSAMLDMMSERDAETIEEIINESFNKGFPDFDESDFYIEIDLHSPIDDFDDF